MKKLLHIENIYVKNNETLILKDICLDLDKSEVLGIIGESGCGKSTLIRSIIGMLNKNEKVVEGNIYFNDKNLTDISSAEFSKIRGNEMGIVFQNPAATLNPTKKIGKQFIEAITSHEKIKKSLCIEKSLNILEKLNLQDGKCILDSYPHEMSGGMNQRIAIALSMILNPQILIADEPTSALDPTIQAQVINEMINIKEEFDTSIIIVTHSMEVISQIADKVAVMYNGEIVEYGRKEDVLLSPSHPYTKALIDSVPKFNGELPKGIKGNPPYFDKNIKGCCFYDRCTCGKEECRDNKQILKHKGKQHYIRCDVMEK
ncbi:MAG: ABC transporter ATP-binding protein [Clostridium sp.]|nr:ABC transporter ATP-binding protein [Clostridium sp.]